MPVIREFLRRDYTKDIWSDPEGQRAITEGSVLPEGLWLIDPSDAGIPYYESVILLHPEYVHAIRQGEPWIGVAYLDSSILAGTLLQFPEAEVLPPRPEAREIIQYLPRLTPEVLGLYNIDLRNRRVSQDRFILIQACTEEVHVSYDDTTVRCRISRRDYEDHLNDCYDDWYYRCAVTAEDSMAGPAGTAIWISLEGDDNPCTTYLRVENFDRKINEPID